jgi:O-antigen/teichoic acid export membrane protein
MNTLPGDNGMIKAESLGKSDSVMQASSSTKFRRIFHILAAFFLGQGVLQSLNLMIGLYLVRALSVESYAQLGLALGFQQTITTLMDLGVAGTIIPLVGEQVHDKTRVGKYVRAAKHLRDRIFLVLAPVSAIAFLAIMSKHNWPYRVQAALLVSVLLALYSSGPLSYYSAPLFLYGRLRDFYLPQSITAGMRLISYLALGTFGYLSASIAALFGALNITINAGILGKKSVTHFSLPETHDPAINREVIQYVLPAIPAVIFSAFQMQIALLLIGIFGQTTSIAQVAALGRISQLFLILTTFNIVVIEPRIAKLSRDRLLSMYVRLVCLAIFFASLVSWFSFTFPQPFIWLLGSKYEEVRSVVGLSVLTACINYITNLIWLMNRARKWLFWRGTLLEIALVLSADVFFLLTRGVQTTRNAVLFTLTSALCGLCVHCYITYYGFQKGPRIVADEIASAN